MTVDVLRLDLVAPPEVPVSALLDDLGTMSITLGCHELAELVAEVRPALEAPGGGLVQRVVPSAWMAPWFPAGIAPPERLGLVLAARPVPAPPAVAGDPPGPLVERQAELLLHAVPSGRFDVSVTVPWVELLAQALGVPRDWPQKTAGGALPAYELPGGWVVLEGSPAHPSHRYGLMDEAQSLVLEEVPP